MYIYRIEHRRLGVEQAQYLILLNFGSSGISGEFFIERNGFGNQGFATADAPELGLKAARLLVLVR